MIQDPITTTGLMIAGLLVMGTIGLFTTRVATMRTELPPLIIVGALMTEMIVEAATKTAGLRVMIEMTPNLLTTTAEMIEPLTMMEDLGTATTGPVTAGPRMLIAGPITTVDPIMTIGLPPIMLTAGVVVMITGVIMTSLLTMITKLVTMTPALVPMTKMVPMETAEIAKKPCCSVRSDAMTNMMSMTETTKTATDGPSKANESAEQAAPPPDREKRTAIGERGSGIMLTLMGERDHVNETMTIPRPRPHLLPLHLLRLLRPPHPLRPHPPRLLHPPLHPLRLPHPPRPPRPRIVRETITMATTTIAVTILVVIVMTAAERQRLPRALLIEDGIPGDRRENYFY